MPHKPIMIMAGGTGGHVYPALAVARYFRSKEIPLFWLGTARGIEARVAPENDIELLTIKVSGIRGRGVLNLLMAPVEIAVAVAQAGYICFKRKPAVVLGMGGFASGPGGIAAWLLRIPLLIHEQNRVAGTTNKILARLATKVMQGFPHTFAHSKKVVTTGNPVRRDIVSLPDADVRGADNDPNTLNVLIVGGSQGAKKLNQIVPLGLDKLSEKITIAVWHQCGDGHYQATEEIYQRLSLNPYKLDAFITDMAGAYRWADVVICRAGALTIAELCTVGLASILVPFPFAIDDHQTENARYLSERDAAILLPEHALSADKIAALLFDLHVSHNKLPTMAMNTRKLAYPDAAELVGSLCVGQARA